MRSPRKSLNYYVPWHGLEEILDLPRSSAAFPIRTTCPLCQGTRLIVFQHTRLTGLWHYCLDCKAGGDLIELAAAAWEVSIPMAVRRLVREELIPMEAIDHDAIGNYCTFHPNRRQAVRQFWIQSQRRLVSEPNRDILRLRRKLHILDAVSRERFVAGPVKFFGAADKQAVDTLFLPNVQPMTSSDRVFHGKNWKDILVVPYFVSPYQPSAFLFVGREGNQTDQVFRHVPFMSRESGLAGLESAMEHSSKTIFAVRDPLLMLRMQMRNFNVSTRPLPLVAWHASSKGHTEYTWALLNGHQLVFWAMQLDAETLLQCQWTGANLVIAGPELLTKRTLDHYLRLHDPAEILRRLQRRSRPWRETLDYWLKTASANQVNDLIQRLEAGGDETRSLLRSCSHSADLGHSSLAIRHTTMNGDYYLERGGSWYREIVSPKVRRERLVLNAIMRVHRIVMRQKGHEYHGSIRAPGGEISFVYQPWTQPMFNRWLMQLSLEHNLKLEIGPGRIDLLQLASSFRAPRVVKGKTKIGWDGHAYHFRYFSITKHKVAAHSPYRFEPTVPGPRQKELLRLNDHNVRRLNLQGPEAELMWATIVCLLQAIRNAQAGHGGPQSIWTGPGAVSSLRAVLARAGVQILKHEYKTDHKSFLWPHKWPVVIQTPWQANILEQVDPLIGYMSLPAQAYALMTYGQYQLVDCQTVLDPFRLRDVPLEHIIPLVLRDELRKADRQTEYDADSWYMAQERLATFLGDHGADVSALRNSESLLHFSDERLLERLAVSLYKTNQLVAREQADGLCVTRKQFLRALCRARLTISPQCVIPAELMLCPELVAGVAHGHTDKETDGTSS